MLDGRSQIRRRAGLRLWLSGGWLLLLVLAAIFAPLISPHIRWSRTCSWAACRRSGYKGAEPGYILGTDSLGRDVLARVLYGARIALVVALAAGGLTG
jgi:dipeptide transport system permease protein